MDNMKKLVLLLTLFCPFIAYSQATAGYHRIAQSLARGTGVQAVVVPYATITVVNTATEAQAIIYSDPGLTLQINPAVLVSDSSGNYNYYFALNSCVTETVTYPGAGSIVTPNICSNTSSEGNAITALTGDVTASGPGSAVATVVEIPPHVTLTGTPSAGFVPTATAINTATWQGPASSIANCFLPMSNGTIFTASVIDQGCTLTNYLNIGGGYGLNLPLNSLGIDNFANTVQEAKGTGTATQGSGSSGVTYIGSGFNGGLVLNVTSSGTGYVSAIAITCTISGGTFTVAATCVAAGNTLNSSLVVEITNPGIYSSASGATISVSGGTGSGWTGTVSLAGGVAQGDIWQTNTNYNFNGQTATDLASSTYTIFYNSRQATSGIPAVEFESQPIQGIQSGWLFNLDGKNNAFLRQSEANLTGPQTISWPNSTGTPVVIVAIVAATNCGSLSGSTGCYQINDGTGTHYIPKW